MTTSDRPRILFIDAYDSFSNNIISLLETSLNAEVSSIRIDTPIGDLAQFLRNYAAVVAGPGPGDARTAGDVGLFQRLWELKRIEAIPVLGICLGFQSLVLAHGGAIERLPEPRHGIVRTLSSNGESIFRNVPLLKAVQYHSLHAIIGIQDHVEQHKSERCQPVDAPFNVHLTPLAWDNQRDNVSMREECRGKSNPESILMAVKHKIKPFWGIQFHPESICSSQEARKIVKNWWDEVCEYRSETPYRHVALDGFFDDNQYSQEANNSAASIESAFETPESNPEQGSKVISTVLDLDRLSVPLIFELVTATDGEAIIFDSENHQNSQTGAVSIIGIIEDVSSRFEYWAGKPEICQTYLGKSSTIKLQEYDNNIFVFLDSYVSQHKAVNGDPCIPFWGGLMGYISYETCLETLEIRDSAQSDSSRSRPDLGFVFVERSIVIDHIRRTVHIQSIKPADDAWVDATTSLLSKPPLSAREVPLRKVPNVKISFPNERLYKSQIRACQAAIRAGDSYELCLTNQVHITTDSKISPWPMYRRLRNMNPAPFGAYVRLGDLVILSSSPERFMRWSRPAASHHNLNGHPESPDAATSLLQFRPIKGTITRRPTPKSAPRSLVEATRLLSTQKEKAENLMIVDLIRHDLHGIAGSGRVGVPKLMVVEEYETVFQLVSVIEGSMLVKPTQKVLAATQRIVKEPESEVSKFENGFHDSHIDVDDQNQSPPSKRDQRVRTVLSSASQPKPSSPLAALPATLPPGSMTGAPKLRSCQILRSLETSPRGVYSGIIGYIDVGGGGDWSVAIRSAICWDEPDAAGGDHWTIGAGGAVTTLSTEQGEWEEMLAKLQATLRIFQD